MFLNSLGTTQLLSHFEIVLLKWSAFSWWVTCGNNKWDSDTGVLAGLFSSNCDTVWGHWYSKEALYV